MSSDLSKIYRFTMAEYKQWQTGIYVCKEPVDDGVMLHWHDHYEIEYVVSGKGKQIFNGVEYPIYPGALHSLMPSDFHELITEEPIRFIKINYQETDVDPFILNTLIGVSNNTPLYFDGVEKELMDAAFSLIARQAEFHHGTTYYVPSTQKLLECILINMIDHLKRTSELGKLDEKGSENIQRVLVYLHQNFKKTLDLKTVAEYVHYSPQHLSKTFHQAMGVTFKGYITNLRMNFAANLIVNTDMSIADISHEAGFGTVQNFNKEFKKFYSYTPSEYRSKQKKMRSKSE